jgi:hypothetical protein
MFEVVAIERLPDQQANRVDLEVGAVIQVQQHATFVQLAVNDTLTATKSAHGTWHQ